MSAQKGPLTEAELKAQRDQEFMGKLKIALPALGPEHEDEEYSKEEFVDDETEKQFREKQMIKNLKKDIRRRRKLAEKELRRYGGDIILWTEKEARKGITLTKKREQMEKEKAEAAAKDEAVKANKSKNEKEKSTKKMKTEKKEKKDKKVKSKKEKKSRGPRVTDGKIILLEKTNPKRQGTRAYKRYELYKKHKDIASYLEAGGKRSSLRYDEKHGYIKLSGLVHGKKEKSDKVEKKEKPAKKK